MTKLKKKMKKGPKSSKIVENSGPAEQAPQYVSRLQFSKILGIAYSTLQHAIKTGKVKVTTRGGRALINVESEKKAYLQSRKGKYRTNLKIGKEDEHGVLLEIGDANLRSAVYKSKTAEVEYWTRLGHIIPVLRVNSLWSNIAKDLQKSVLGIAPRIGPLMAGITDPHEATQTLKHELNLALTRIAEKGLKNEGFDDSEPNNSADVA